MTREELEAIEKEANDFIKIPCNCSCHRGEAKFHMVPCCNNGFQLIGIQATPEPRAKKTPEERKASNEAFAKYIHNQVQKDISKNK